MHRIKGSAELSLTGIALAISRSENIAFSLFKVVSICNTLNPQMDIYYKSVSYAIIGNAQKNLLTVARVFPVLDQC